MLWPLDEDAWERPSCRYSHGYAAIADIDLNSDPVTATHQHDAGAMREKLRLLDVLNTVLTSGNTDMVPR